MPPEIRKVLSKFSEKYTFIYYHNLPFFSCQFSEFVRLCYKCNVSICLILLPSHRSKLSSFTLPYTIHLFGPILALGSKACLVQTFCVFLVVFLHNMTKRFNLLYFMTLITTDGHGLHYFSISFYPAYTGVTCRHSCYLHTMVLPLHTSVHSHSSATPIHQCYLATLALSQYNSITLIHWCYLHTIQCHCLDWFKHLAFNVTAKHDHVLHPYTRALQLLTEHCGYCQSLFKKAR